MKVLRQLLYLTKLVTVMHDNFINVDYGNCSSAPNIQILHHQNPLIIDIIFQLFAVFLF